MVFLTLGLTPGGQALFCLMAMWPMARALHI